MLWLDGIYSFLLRAYTLIKTRNPCKKCIVRACCSLPCEYKVLLDNFLFPYNIVYKQKVLIIVLSIHKMLIEYNMYIYMLLALLVTLFYILGLVFIAP
jgi:hypothetical protein